ncbi:TlpA family protein disulfide reductase [Thermosediminibacter oceani]|uniref:Alkyl hydroperoxide reductase/ Thiol specific antioxidant/ Mal allergen n=1 Tax=Thermosediminibacter oceani (strain ATCC BAA-1034 / DSM 16646 / JW/IW-1228P) TaxID=555079 RepID=D9S1X3_THEOJ|nr:TlpA disulfide reductase family protein [Thermosediminibacter oceani]ADL07400.1 alkyl hydroperoxide reductase/ Thiol specific antioxidant/ Mal allergen [Thermosediminibacter oceani DSM 16646]
MRSFPEKSKTFGLLTVIVFITLYLAGCGKTKVETANPEPEIKPYEGFLAPDFELPDLSGRKVRLSNFRGKTVVLNFWSLNCSYCLAEMPDFEEFNATKPENVAILMINLDRDAGRVATYIKNKGYTFTVLKDDSAQTVRSYLIRGVPTTVVAGGDGVIKARIEGQVTKQILDSLVN